MALTNNIDEDREVLSLLKENDQKAMETIFDQYYVSLCNLSRKIINHSAGAEDIVQDVMLDIWTKRQKLELQYSLQAYLRKAVTYKSIDYLRKHKKQVITDVEEAMSLKGDQSASDNIELSELEEKVRQAIDGLAPKCKAVFILNRFEDLSNKEIAAQLDISVKTVENQVTKALKQLKNTISPEAYLYLITLF